MACTSLASEVHSKQISEADHHIEYEEIQRVISRASLGDEYFDNVYDNFIPGLQATSLSEALWSSSLISGATRWWDGSGDPSLSDIQHSLR